MKATVSYNDFSDSFTGSYKDNFSYEGKKALFNYLEEMEKETGVELELDPIAYCVEFTEYENLAAIKEAYKPMIRTLDDLEMHTTVIKVPATKRLIIGDF